MAVSPLAGKGLAMVLEVVRDLRKHPYHNLLILYCTYCIIWQIVNCIITYVENYWVRILTR
jgi:hypothetical protein